MPSVKDLLDAPYGLFVLGGEAERRALWEAVAGACETLYVLGPISEKPVLPCPIRVWLLECAPPERVQGLREILRRDPHAVHAIGPADDELIGLFARAALSGCVAVVEIPGSLPEVLERLRAAVPPVELWSALRGIGSWRPSAAARIAGAKGAPAAELLDAQG